MSWTNCKLLQSPQGISENEQVWPKDFQNRSLSKKQESWCRLSQTSGSFLQWTDVGMFGSIDAAQISCIYKADGRQFSFSSCHTEFLWELRVSLQLCTRMFPVCRRFALLSCALARIKEAEGTNGFPCILNSLLYWFFLCHLKFNIGKIPVHHLNQ